jgi:UDP-glucose 4-epimerase
VAGRLVFAAAEKSKNLKHQKGNRRMKILLTGGAGFIGSNVADAYVKAGHQVVIVDDLSTGKRENLNPGAEFHHMSIGDPGVEEIFRRHSFDLMNHHAAQIDVRKSVADPVFDATTNILHPIRLLKCCRQYGVKKVVYSSTGGAIYGEPVYLPADEKHQVRPLAPYGISKHVFEHYIELYHDLYGLDYTILRYGNVYGPRQDPHGEAGVVAIFSGLLLSGKPCRIFGDGGQTRDYVYVGDVVRANLMALDGGSGQIMNVGTGIETSVTDLYGEMARIIGTDAAPIHEAERPGEVSRIYLKIDHANRILGWKPQVSLKEGLENTINYFRSRA